MLIFNFFNFLKTKEIKIKKTKILVSEIEKNGRIILSI